MRRRMSRSENMPTTRSPSITTRQPMWCLFISRAAFSTEVAGLTVWTSLPLFARMSWTQGIVGSSVEEANHECHGCTEPVHAHSHNPCDPRNPWLMLSRTDEERD